MAVENVFIADSPSVQGAWGLKLRPGESALSPRITWTTMYEYGNLQQQFRVQVRWRGIPKGGTGNGTDGFTQWSSWQTTLFDPDDCHPNTVASDDLLHWWVNLSSVAPVSSMNGGSWTYEARAFDQLDIDVLVTSLTPELNTVDYTGGNTLFVGAYPEYTVTSIYPEGDNIVITYSAPGWTRKDDRWEILSWTKNGAAILRPNTWGSQAGRIEKVGWIVIPKSATQRLIEAGDSLYLSIRWNAVYRPIAMEWVDWRGTITVSDTGTTNLPTGDVTVNPDGSITVDLGESGSGTDLGQWHVTIEGGGFEFDNVHAVMTSPNALLNYPPLDVDFKVQIQGSTVTGGSTSGIVEQTVHVPSNGAMLIDPIDSAGNRTSNQVRATTNIAWDASGSRDKTVVKFAGRDRPSVAFGTGGTVNVNASWDVFRNRMDYPDSSSIRALIDAGLVVLRVPGGERYLVALDSVQTSEAAGQPYTSVSISGQEVD